jgi:ArsR family transcriptional regulator, arsenate/arsenite/antimonite-responsive transcriptional repressor
MPTQPEQIFTPKQDELAKLAKALSHPVRIYVLDLLSKQSCCYSGDLSEELPIAKSTLSQHLKELKKANLIQGEIEPPKIKYCLNRKAWEQAHQLFHEFFNNQQISSSCESE